VNTNNSPTVDLVTGFPQEVGLDTAAGFYYAIVNGGGGLGSKARLLRGPIGGAVTHQGFLVRADVDSSKAISGSGYDLLDVRDFALDPSTNILYFIELLTGVQEMGIYRMDLTSKVITQMVSSAQFPDTASGGYMIDLEVDPTTGTVTVTVVPGQETTAIELLAGGASKLSFTAIPGLTYRIQSSDNLTPGSWIYRTNATANAPGGFSFTESAPLPPKRFYRCTPP
jgi:hypothetical protein